MVKATNWAELPFLRILCPLILGISISYPFAAELKPLFLFTPLLFLYFTLFLILITYQKWSWYKRKATIGLLINIVLFLTGCLLGVLNNSAINPKFFKKTDSSALKVWILTEPKSVRNHLIFDVQVAWVLVNNKWIKTTGKLAIVFSSEQKIVEKLTYGDELILNANINVIAEPQNPNVFHYKNWMASKDVYYQAYISDNQFVKTGENQGNRIFRFALNLREKQTEIFKSLLKSKEAEAMASTLILGQRADLSQETISTYSKTGTIHALSVSGMHVGIVYAVVNWLLAKMDRKKGTKTIKTILICSLIWFYALITGFSASVLRSAIMITVFIIAKTFHKTSNSFNILAFTAFTMILFEPFIIFDLGFQLSFLAVLGLVYLYPKINRWFYTEVKWINWIWSAVAISLAAQIFTFPLSIYYFHQFPTYFIFSNLFILLPITILMYLGISILLFKLNFLAPLFELLINVMNDGLKWIANLPFSTIDQIWLSELELGLLVWGLTLLIYGLSNYKKVLILSSLCIFLTLQTSLSLKYINAYNQKLVIAYYLTKEYAIAFIERDIAFVVTNLQIEDNRFQMQIMPSLSNHRINEIQLISWEENFSFRNFQKKEHQIQFHHLKFLLYDNCLKEIRLIDNPRFAYIWIHEIRTLPPEQINELRLGKNLIIDASTSTVLAKKLEENLDKKRTQILNLKKNKAYLIDLNKKH